MPDGSDEVIRLQVKFSEADVEREAARAQDQINAKMAAKQPTQTTPTTVTPAQTTQQQAQAVSLAGQVAPPNTPANAAARTAAARILATGGSIQQAQTAAVIAAQKHQGQNTTPPAAGGGAGGGFNIPTGLGAAAFGFAGSGGAGGGLGVLVGLSGKAGLIGLAAIALKEMTEAAEHAARGLANYSGELFGAVTGLDLALEGLKFRLASDVGPGLAVIIRDIGMLAVAMEPLIARTVNFVTDILDPILKRLAMVPTYMDVAASAILVTSRMMEVDLTGWFKRWINGLNGIMGAIFDQRSGPKGDHRVFDIDKVPKGMNDLLDSLKKDLQNLNDTGKNLEKAMKASQDDGAQIMTGLFRAMDGWAHPPGGDFNKGNFGPIPFSVPRMTPSVQRALLHPDRPQFDAAGNWIAQHAPNAANPAGHITATGMPRPTPAAINLHTADVVTVNASDYDRIHSEMMMVVDRVYSEMRGMQDSRWMRMARARMDSLPRGLPT